jgi:hypothetical protein
MALQRGVSVSVDKGDVLSDVLKYWSHVVANPTFLFHSESEWQFNAVHLDSGAIQIYSNFTVFIHLERQKAAEVEERFTDDGFDLTSQTGVSFFDLHPECGDDENRASDDNDDLSPDHDNQTAVAVCRETGFQGIIKTQVTNNIRPPR